eukprot:CAMPEP_0170527880 /NCGR_PEP_ID=MMETSP0209-20121228/13367_1 /TAXON_ID=665100 ORGANISM="Litonotus pictus, Strain P1" /NCGR_SAMPLE_ID=MMETSP0209 /ASSEMBLY_ACC=CAM_ASM_000301 /LENGTH=355 /DNA_ID=CAMNT_0010818727 /DNA_START=476 /DNA_END=1543 /DNA_ORIENTATION=-
MLTQEFNFNYLQLQMAQFLCDTTTKEGDLPGQDLKSKDLEKGIIRGDFGGNEIVIKFKNVDKSIIQSPTKNNKNTNSKTGLAKIEGINQIAPSKANSKNRFKNSEEYSGRESQVFNNSNVILINNTTNLKNAYNNNHSDNNLNVRVEESQSNNYNSNNNNNYKINNKSVGYYSSNMTNPRLGSEYLNYGRERNSPSNTNSPNKRYNKQISPISIREKEQFPDETIFFLNRITGYLKRVTNHQKSELIKKKELEKKRKKEVSIEEEVKPIEAESSIDKVSVYCREAFSMTCYLNLSFLLCCSDKGKKEYYKSLRKEYTGRLNIQDVLRKQYTSSKINNIIFTKEQLQFIENSEDKI